MTDHRVYPWGARRHPQLHQKARSSGRIAYFHASLEFVIDEGLHDLQSESRRDVTSYARTIVGDCHHDLARGSRTIEHNAARTGMFQRVIDNLGQCHSKRCRQLNGQIAHFSFADNLRCRSVSGMCGGKFADQSDNASYHFVKGHGVTGLMREHVVDYGDRSNTANRLCESKLGFWSRDSAGLQSK